MPTGDREFLLGRVVFSGDEEAESVRFAQLLASVEEAAISELLGQIDESDYSPTDWARALLGFDSWLEKQGVEARPFGEMVGYVHCCTLGNAKTIASPELEVVLLQCLENFGFEAVRGSHD